MFKQVPPDPNAKEFPISASIKLPINNNIKVYDTNGYRYKFSASISQTYGSFLDSMIKNNIELKPGITEWEDGGCEYKISNL